MCCIETYLVWNSFENICHPVSGIRNFDENYLKFEKTIVFYMKDCFIRDFMIAWKNVANVCHLVQVVHFLDWNKRDNSNSSSLCNCGGPHCRGYPNYLKGSVHPKKHRYFGSIGNLGVTGWTVTIQCMRPIHVNGKMQ